MELNTPPMQEVDANISPEDIFVSDVDQGDDALLSIPEEIDTNVPLDLSVARFVGSAASPVQGVPMELIEARISPIHVSVIMTNPNKLVGPVVSMDVSIEDVEDVAPYASDDVRDMATPGYGSEEDEQDGPPLHSLVSQERFSGSEAWLDSCPVVPSNLLPESPVEVSQWFNAEIEEASSGQQVAKLHQEELLARGGDFS